MIIIKGNKKLNISKEDFERTLEKYKEVTIDLGAGDGRFVYKSALEHPNKLFIGIDPSASQLEIYSRKSVRRKQENVLYIVGSLETEIEELYSVADALHINLPWGSLLQAIVKPKDSVLDKLNFYLKENCKIKILLGYTQTLEPSEFQRLNLPEISEDYILKKIIPPFESKGFSLDSLSRLSAENLKDFETTWSKKLHLTKDRPLYYIQLVRIPK